MPRIRVRPHEITALRQRLVTVQNNGSSALNALGQVRTSLDWQITSRQSIDTRLSSIQRRLQTQMELMGQYGNFLNRVNDSFMAADRSLREQTGGCLYQMGQITEAMRNPIPSRINRGNSAILGGLAAVGGLFGARSDGPNALLNQLRALREEHSTTVALDRMSGAVRMQSTDAYKLAIERQIAEELRMMEPGLIHLIPYMLSFCQVEWIDKGGCGELWLEASLWAKYIPDTLSDLGERLACGANPNQLRAFEHLVGRWDNPVKYFLDAERAGFRDKVVRATIKGGISAGLVVLKVFVPPVGIPLKAVWDTYKWGSRVTKVLGPIAPNQIREARDHAVADLSLQMSLYNDMRTNGQASQADIDSAFQQTVDSTSAILNMELELERRAEGILMKEFPGGIPTDLAGRPISPNEVSRLQNLEESRQRLERLQQKIDEVESLRTGVPTPNANDILQNAASFFGGQG